MAKKTIKKEEKGKKGGKPLSKKEAFLEMIAKKKKK